MADIALSIQWMVSGIALASLGIASYTDLKTREVPDWLSYGLVAAGAGMNGLFSIILRDPSFILQSLLGFLIFFGIAAAMFYTGQWGGGDSKILMGMGALIGWHTPAQESLLLAFLFNVLIVGAVYGMMWSIFLALKHRKSMAGEIKNIRKDKNFRKVRSLVIAVSVVAVFISLMTQNAFLRLYWLIPAAMAWIIFYVWLFVKAVEKAAMIKKISPDNLTEGDWIAKEIRVKGKYICGPKDLGIEKKQIAMLKTLYKKKRIGKVVIKEGIPFVPSFLIGFTVSMVWGNLLFILIQVV